MVAERKNTSTTTDDPVKFAEDLPVTPKILETKLMAWSWVKLPPTSKRRIYLLGTDVGRPSLFFRPKSHRNIHIQWTCPKTPRSVWILSTPFCLQFYFPPNQPGGNSPAFSAFCSFCSTCGSWPADPSRGQRAVGSKKASYQSVGYPKTIKNQGSWLL